jgi:hypothetical protein
MTRWERVCALGGVAVATVRMARREVAYIMIHVLVERKECGQLPGSTPAPRGRFRGRRGSVAAKASPDE